MATTNRVLLQRAESTIDELAVTGNAYVNVSDDDITRFSEILRKIANEENVRVMIKNHGNGEYRVLLRKNYWLG